LTGDINVGSGGESRGQALADNDGEGEREGDDEWKLDPGVNARIRMFDDEREYRRLREHSC